MFNDSSKFVIIEMILNDDRYCELKDIIADDFERMCAINQAVTNVLRKSSHELHFKTFVDIELDRLMEENA